MKQRCLKYLLLVPLSLALHTPANAQIDSIAAAKSCIASHSSLSFPIQLSSGRKLDAKVLRPIFEGLARATAQSPLSSLCESTPRFECWDQKGIPPGQVEFFEVSASRVVVRVTCATGAYNSSSYFAAFGIGTSSRKRTTNSKRQPPAVPMIQNTSSVRGPALILFPQHPGLTSGPHALWGLKSMEAIVGARAYEGKTNSLFAYTKGLENGTMGHFHHFVFTKKEGLPLLKMSASKIIEDGKGEYHFDLLKSRVPPTTSSWVRFIPKSELRGCLSNFQEFSCRKIAL